MKKHFNVSYQVRQRERFGFGLLQPGKLPVRVGKVHQALPLTFDRIQSADGLADGCVADLIAVFGISFRLEIGEKRTGEGYDRGDRVHDLMCQYVHQLVVRLVFFPVKFAVEFLLFVFRHQAVDPVEGCVKTSLLFATCILGKIKHRFIVFNGIQKELYPTVGGIEKIDE